MNEFCNYRGWLSQIICSSESQKRQSMTNIFTNILVIVISHNRYLTNSNGGILSGEKKIKKKDCPKVLYNSMNVVIILQGIYLNF